MGDEIKVLKNALAERDKEIEFLKSKIKEPELEEKNNSQKFSPAIPSSLTQQEIKRYSRQLILPEISVEGQIALKNSRVLIVGAGGLGCPVGLYLTGAGVGTIGIVDYDVVDISNLHRQTSHTESFLNKSKCASLEHSLKNLNSCTQVNTHPTLLNSSNVEEIIKLYDVIVDASDNVPTRYLLNDAAVLFKKPLVSGSALKLEGQLTIYNYSDGPCYRCLFPNPPSQDVVTNCSDGGVLGAVTGIIGSLQALETIKIIVGLGPSYFQKMLLFDGLTGDFRTFKLRGKKKDCDICGSNPSITKLLDYEVFCNAKANDKDNKVSLLSDSERISCIDYKDIVDSGIPHILVDVRPEHEIKICCLPNSVNIPINKISSEASISMLGEILGRTCQPKHFVVCRRGNDSQKAVKVLQKNFGNFLWFDIIGGLYAWHDEVDRTFPVY